MTHKCNILCVINEYIGVSTKYAYIAQQAEHFLGKEEVTGSTPVISSNKKLYSIYNRIQFFSANLTFTVNLSIIEAVKFMIYSIDVLIGDVKVKRRSIHVVKPVVLNFTYST